MNYRIGLVFKSPKCDITLQLCIFIYSIDNDRQSKSGLKTQDVNYSERRLTARQQSKQDAAGQLEPATSDKQRQVNSLTQSVEPAGVGRQPTRCSTRVVKRPKRDLSPPESPVKKGKFILFFTIHCTEF